MVGKKLENLEKWPEIGKIKPKVKELWYRGNLELLDRRPKLAIVGSRRMSSYGAMIIEHWMSELVASGVVIVSGFMYGVDQKAHSECLNDGGMTIGVLGWGIDRPAAEMDMKLEKQMEEKGLFLSEYEGRQEAALWMFPARNRIVAGMCDAVLVVEAAEKSGSLITADLALKMGKPLLALPGNITSRVSSGTNWLIAKNKAKMVRSVSDVLEALGLSRPQLRSYGGQADPILELLADEPRMIDEIAKITRRNVGEVMAKLSEWELVGVVENRGGKYFYVMQG